jgi:hypothetical protein
MGTGMGSAGAMGAGAIAASRNASMSAPAFGASSGQITVARVLAPDRGWLVVRSAAPTGGVLGFTPVTRGENRDVAVRLGSADGRNVRVTLYVDRGVRGSFDYDPDRLSSALDKPVLVNGAPVEFPATLTGWGIDANPNTVLVMAGDQKAGPELDMAYLLTPAPSWVEVRAVRKGVAANTVGVLLRPAGEFHHVKVPITGAQAGDRLVVTVLADRGVPGLYEPPATGEINGLDQPWVSAGVVASQQLQLR